MEAVNGGKIILSLGINLILFSVGAAGDCIVSIYQPPYLDVNYTQKPVTMQCSFSTAGCPAEQPTILWFRYGAHQPENLCLDGCTKETDKFTVVNLAQDKVSLTINRVAFDDSAIYICGVAFPSSAGPRAKGTGGGTVLVVRDTKVLSKELLAPTVLLSLLCVYVTGVFGVFIVLAKSKSNTLRKKETENSQKKKSARRIFQEIAQELYNKRHAERSQQPEKDNTYENRRGLSNYEIP
ncbi:immunoglobulin superfamily member 6 [Vicugna pacos]|uniref:immunoglobulin superfamily member 6 n=1 Tax=Vicugna pacos TaxID=30538 RepID=UPI0003C830C2|nr:immunoglobulin superfamily member 6 [Vicugna pacos]